MAVPILKNQIIAWLKEQDYWLQYAGNKLIEEGIVNADLLDNTYKLFCEEYELSPLTIEQTPITFSEIDEDQHVAIGDIKLKGIKEIAHVNALAEGQIIKVGSNLTIIYGANGSGKTGYIRLLNNAFITRGDKQILQNVYDGAAAGEPSCKFIFQSGETPPYEIEYPRNKERVEFTQYAVFDSFSARVHLENDNKLNFTPNGFQFFEQMIELFDGVKEKLIEAIKVNKPHNTFANLFVNDNNIKTAITNLGTGSDEEELQRMGIYDEAIINRHAELTKKIAELRALNIPKKIHELQGLSGQIATFITQEQEILDSLGLKQIENYKALIDSYHNFQRLVKEQGIKNLEKYNIEEIGSPEWKDFIKAAKKYLAVLEATKNDGIAYPKEKDQCLFCLQPLAQKEIDLIKAYWSLLNSHAEIELSQIVEKIKLTLKKLRALVPVSFTEEVIIYDYIKSNKPELAARWKQLAGEIETTRKNAISNLSNCNNDQPFSSYEMQANELCPVKEEIDITIQELMKKNPELEIQELERELQFLNDKNLLSKMVVDVLSFVKAHKWASKAEGCLVAFRTNSITSKQGALFAEHISDKFTETFSNECGFLNAPTAVTIVQRNAKMSTLRRLQVAGELANRILSEGEQRSISLADFLTEAQLNPYNKGIIFDDPVNSLDHERKELIAKRLVKIAARKQVVIFTHDLSFLIRLKIEAENSPDVDLSLTSIRRTANIAGIVLPDLPWIAQNIKVRIGTLKDKIVRIKKIRKEGTEDDYNEAIKSWYLFLREAWERAIEERLFKGVLERFSFGIQTQKLKKIEITPELLDAIEEGMTESSKWVHDAAAGLNPATPEPDKLDQDLKFFENFAEKCKAA